MPVYKWSRFLANRDGRTDQLKVVQEVLADLKRISFKQKFHNHIFPLTTHFFVSSHSHVLKMITFEGNVPAWKPGKKNPYEGSPAWDKHERMNWAYRSHDAVRTRMRVENGTEWGAVRSHLYEKYPECVERNWKQYVKMSKERKEVKILKSITVSYK